MEVTQQEFAELLGKHRQAVWRDVKRGLLPVNSHRRIETTDPGVLEYLEKRMLSLPGAPVAESPTPTPTPTPTPKKKKPAPRKKKATKKETPKKKPKELTPLEAAESDAAIMEEIKKKNREATSRLSGRPITASSDSPRSNLELKKLAAETQFRELKAAQLEGTLVSRESMIRGVWNPLETFLVRLLADGSKTIASRVYPVARSGGTVEDVEVEVRKQVSTLIKPLIQSVERALPVKMDDGQ